MKKTIEHCCLCANPKIEGYRNSYGQILSFTKHEQGLLCMDCYNFLRNHHYFSHEYFHNELEKYFLENNRILFAYSGGLDSTAVLFKLTKECRKRNIELEVFTVDTGFKGEKTIKNVNRVIERLDLTENHSWFDIKDMNNYYNPVTDLIGRPETTSNVYKHCWKNEILPCGRICNSIMEGAYIKMMQTRGCKSIFTGGDTPKINSDGKYSILWYDGTVLTVRGGYAFGLSKMQNAQIIKENKIPWVNPNCGGYDTDCLIPGVFFAQHLRGNNIVDVETLYEAYPIIFYYLSERTRFDIIDRETSIKMMKKVDICDLSSYIELNEIMNH